MRLRTLLVTTVTGTLLAGAVGAVGVPAQANRAPSPAAAGSVFAWGGEAAGDARTVPADLTAPVADIATSNSATAAVTADGKLRVWGTGTEVDDAPTGVTDAVAVALAYAHGAILHADGKVTAWGDPDFEAVPSDLRAKAIAVGAGGTGYAVRTNGELMTWGAEGMPIPEGGLSDLVDVSYGATGQVLALHTDGTIESLAMDPSLATVPDLGGKKVTQVVAGAAANGLVLEDGTIEVWGAAAPADEPDFGGKKVVSLALGTFFFSAIGGAVTEDGVVHTWGVPTGIAEHPASLTGKPAADIALGLQHAVVIVTTPFQELTKPAITGTPQVGQTLTAKPATFNLTPNTPATGQWYADAAPIAGKTGTTLVLDQAVVGKKISYRTTATRYGKTLTSASNELGPVTAVIAPPPAAKATSTVSAAVKATGKTKKVTKKVTITVTVKTTPGVSPAGKVTVTLKGKTKKKVTATVNASGKATVTVKKVKHGKYKAELAYAGNANVASSKATKKFKA